MIVVITDNAKSYGHDVAKLRDTYGARIEEMNPRLGQRQLRSKLSLLPPLLFPNVFRYRRAWTGDDDVVAVSWYLLPVLLLTKLRLVHLPRTIVSWGLIVQSGRLRRLFSTIVRLLQNDRLFFIADSSVEGRDVIGIGRVPTSRVAVKPFREFGGLPSLPSTGEDYIFSGGYTNRDYELFCAAIDGLDIPVKISATPKNEFPDPLPANVILDTTFDPPRFREMIAGSRMVVIPLKASGGGSGHSVMLQALQYGKIVIVTRHPAIEDSVGRDYPGFVPPGDVDAMAKVIRRCLDEPAFDSLLRDQIAHHHAEVNAWPPIADEIVTILRDLHPDAPPTTAKP
jgi:hypothetical protein